MKTLNDLVREQNALIDDLVGPAEEDESKYQPVQPITVTPSEYPALTRLATQVSTLAAQGTQDLQAALESDGIKMPRELLDLAISISIGESS